MSKTKYNKNNNPVLIVTRAIVVWSIFLSGGASLALLIGAHSMLLTPKTDIQFYALMCWVLFAAILQEKRWYNSNSIIKTLAGIVIICIMAQAASVTGVI